MQKGAFTDNEVDRKLRIYKQINRQRDRKTDKQKDVQTDKPADKKVNKHLRNSGGETFDNDDLLRRSSGVAADR